MAQDISIEVHDAIFLITARTIGSRLWFINNPELEDRFKAYLAKYATLYGAVLYGFKLMGNHYHLLASFPLCNRAAFLRSLNSMFARLTGSLAVEHDGGRVWARRARCQFLLRPEDVEHWFFYVALNSVQSGLCRRLSEDPLYNSFSNAVSGRVETFKIVDWEDFNNRSRFNPRLTIEDCTEVFELKFARLPGCEHFSTKDYQARMLEKLEVRRTHIVADRMSQGKGFAPTDALRSTKPGSKPRSTKTSTRNTPRPLCLTLCKEAKERFLGWYFDLLAAFRDASIRFRSGDLTVQFPPGTYRPPLAVGVS